MVRTILVGALVAFAVLNFAFWYGVKIGNIGVLKEGCHEDAPGLKPVAHREPKWRWVPPRYVCLYRTRSGQIVERGA
jgi:hypothetical protein